MSDKAILFSIRPQYADKIFEGAKTVELRRVCPKYIKEGSLALIYVSSPVKSLSGAFEVDRVVEEPIEELWKMVNDRAGVTHQEFEAYYNGVRKGTGIFFSKVSPLPEPIKLEDLRRQMKDFHPPQGFRYATSGELASYKQATDNLSSVPEIFPKNLELSVSVRLQIEKNYPDQPYHQDAASL